MAPDGVTLTRRLADRLGVVSGDILTIEVMKGRRYKRDLPVNAIADELIGMASYMNTDTLNRLTGEGEVASAAAMYVDPGELSALSQRLRELPVIETVAMKAHTIELLSLGKIAGLVLVTAGILTTFTIIVAIGVGVQQRSHRIAGARLGIGKSSDSWFHPCRGCPISEFTAEMTISIPLGLLLSRAIVASLAQLHSNEIFQIPDAIEPRTYLAAVLIVVAAALASALVITCLSATPRCAAAYRYRSRSVSFPG